MDNTGIQLKELKNKHKQTWLKVCSLMNFNKIEHLSAPKTGKNQLEGSEAPGECTSWTHKG